MLLVKVGLSNITVVDRTLTLAGRYDKIVLTIFDWL